MAPVEPGHTCFFCGQPTKDLTDGVEYACNACVSQRDPNREHMTDGTPCWCGPTEKEVDGGVIVIHRDALGRQLHLGHLNDEQEHNN